MTVEKIVERAAATLAEAGVPTPRVDAEWIVAHALGMNRSDLVADSHKVREDAAVWPLVERRAAREPLAYILGEWDFRRLTLRCDARALVPRPETEQVVERCLALLREVPEPRVLDVGTGTGAIALSLKDERPDARVVALDASAGALALARENAALTGLDIELLYADLHDGLPAGPFDLVVSNPPYVLAAEMDALDPEVRDWEPRAALVDEGQTEALVRAARPALAPGGRLVLEVHADGAGAAVRLLENAGYADVRITQDLANRDRVVEGENR
jgi:release factor glutamine methyltransferase